VKNENLLSFFEEIKGGERKRLTSRDTSYTKWASFILQGMKDIKALIFISKKLKALKS